MSKDASLIFLSGYRVLRFADKIQNKTCKKQLLHLNNIYQSNKDEACQKGTPTPPENLSCQSINQKFIII